MTSPAPALIPAYKFVHHPLGWFGVRSERMKPLVNVPSRLRSRVGFVTQPRPIVRRDLALFLPSFRPARTNHLTGRTNRLIGLGAGVGACHFGRLSAPSFTVLGLGLVLAVAVGSGAFADDPSSAPDASLSQEPTAEQSVVTPAKAEVEVEPAAAVAEPATEQPVDQPAGVSPVSAPESEPAAEGLPAVGASDVQQPLRLRFSFSGAGWREVVAWLAEETGMALHVGDVPGGTFTYNDPEAFTTDEAITRLNLFLIPQSYAIVRRGQLLSVISLADPRSLQQLDALAALTPLDELDSKGDHEVVKCIVPLGDVNASDATAELRPLMLMTTPVVLPRSNQLVITETAGKLRNIVAVLKSMEVEAPVEVEVRRFDLKHADLASVLLVAGRHLGIPPNQTEGLDISISADLTGKRLYVTGTEERIERLAKLLEMIDVPDDQAKSIEGQTLRAHAVGAEALQSVYEVLQTILAGKSLRLSMDTRTGSVVALADEATHREIERTIQELQAPSVEFAVVDLGRLDPYFVVNLIGEMFEPAVPADSSSRSSSRSTEPPGPTGPRVDADPANRRLFVRGTADQIRQIRQLVESLSTQPAGAGQDQYRLLPLTGQRRRQILEEAERYWQGENRLQILSEGEQVEASASVIERVLHPGVERRTSTPATTRAGQSEPEASLPKRSQHEPVRKLTPAELDSAAYIEADARLLGRSGSSVATAEPADWASHSVEIPEPVRLTASNEERPDPAPAIRGRLVPEGILLQSDDIAALDRFQQHLMDIADASGKSPSPPVVFYLKYVNADQAVKMLADLFDAGKSLANTPAGSLVRGGTAGSYYFGSFTTQKDGLTKVTAGTATIVSDARLNRLIIQGTIQDVAQIEEYLKIIDKAESLTSIETAGRSHVIELLHTNATEIAEMIRQAYVGRVASPTPQGGQQPPQQPQGGDNRGGGDRQRGGDNQRDVIDKPTRDRSPEMTVAVHQQSNSLVITAPDSLFAEVEALVRSIDQRGEQVVEVIPAAQGVDLEMILRSLQTGEPTTSSRGGTRTSSRGSDDRRGR